MKQDVPEHQRRRSPSMGDWIDALLLSFPCASCGEPIMHRKNCEYDHVPPLADRLDERWTGIHPNDPRYIEFRHIKCHAIKSGKEHTARSKAKRVGAAHEEHRERMQSFELPAPTQSSFKRKWPKRPFQKRRLPK